MQQRIWHVAVFWPGSYPEGYGARADFSTRGKALREVAHLKRLGYGKARNPIHLWWTKKGQIEEFIENENTGEDMDQHDSHGASTSRSV